MKPRTMTPKPPSTGVAQPPPAAAQPPALLTLAWHDANIQINEATERALRGEIQQAEAYLAERRETLLKTQGLLEGLRQQRALLVQQEKKG